MTIIITILKPSSQEIDLLTQSIQSLTAAKNKFQESGECVKKQANLSETATILVPLTGSMYVPGTIANKDSFLIEIGTGYFVKMNSQLATDFFARKVKFLDTQVNKYIQLAQEKVCIREVILRKVNP